MMRHPNLEIERLAPTGEGVAHLDGKTVFVEGALPGELVDAEIYSPRARFARARTLGVGRPSKHRRATDEHSARCGGTDWAYFEPDAALSAKRELFLETLKRLGGISPDAVGDLPVFKSPLEYRLRNQFHLRGRSLGFFERHSHRIVPLDSCEIVSAQTRERLCAIVAERDPDESAAVETIETVETVETSPTHDVAMWNRTRDEAIGAAAGVEVRCRSASFFVSARSFFQVNRFRMPHLAEELERRAAAVGGESALDAYSGVGFLAHPLAAAGYRVTAVESSAWSLADARLNVPRFPRPDAVRIVGSTVEAFLADSPAAFDLVVADPPRSGLGARAADLASRARRALFYVSCDPASLARDLRAILPLGFEIEDAFLEDFFPLTHRVEAFVALRRFR